MKYLGIDPSYTGFAQCLRVTGCAAPDMEAMCRTAPDKFPNRQARLVRLRSELRLVLKFAGPAVLVAVEGYSMGSKQGREFAGELGGMVRLELWEQGITYLDVSPSTLKAFVTGKGVAPKEIMLREVYRKWGYSAEDNNAGDAYALSQFAEAYALRETGTKAFQKLASKCVLVSSGLTPGLVSNRLETL